MNKRARVKRSSEELREELKEQVALLKNASDSYDKGLEAIGKHIALILRVFLHHHGNSRALLEQLSLRDKRFPNSSGAKLNPNNLGTDCHLTVIHLTDEGARYLPLIAAGGGPLAPVWEKFPDWWNEPIIKDNQGRKFCRREIILNVADTDGGAHVDPELDAAYMELSRRNSLGWIFQKGDVAEMLKGRPELACVRQIAFEVLESLKKYAAWSGA